ncbi:hypothetical protein LX16_4833 [Stackebrandtia albiflava]|uniref:NAD glycohydrolase translocation F5/8 type C domain-containing protein n=2 Tax=Stackebrandtia albiflava TaxID=406432 RepID=A0A562UPZ6_9ACTN|nr:hypothetical protein LX16_4833 [Stackebrandtia albiflava]
MLCERCGTRANADEQFCGDCGEYLDWDAARADEPAPPEPSEPPAAEEAADPEQPGPVAVQPAPVKPGEAVNRPTSPAPAASRPEETGASCRSCGTGNATHRRYCRRCGTELTAPAEPERTTWWGRLLAWWRARRTHPAGHRRRLTPRRWGRVVVVTLLIAAVVGVIAAFPGRPVVDWAVNSVMDRFSDRAPVVPVEVTASSVVGGFGADDAFDGVSNEYWAPDPASDGVGEWIEARFAEPVRLVDVLVSSGASRVQEDFLGQARPAGLEITFTDVEGETTVAEVSLQDSAEPQKFGFGVSDVVSVRFTITSMYGHEPGRHVAVGEVEFFTRA